MEAKARARYIRIAPRKARLVVDLIRGKQADEAAAILKFTTRAASKAILKVLNSAVANARQAGARGDGLKVAEAYVDEGPTLKRFRPRAMGRATRIRKRTSHITIVVSEIAPASAGKPAASPKKAAKGVQPKPAEAKPAAKKAGVARGRRAAKKPAAEPASGKGKRAAAEKKTAAPKRAAKPAKRKAGTKED